MVTPSMGMKLMRSSAAMKPTVPNTRMGGKSFSVSRPLQSRALKATELLRPIVGMKKAIEIT